MPQKKQIRVIQIIREIGVIQIIREISVISGQKKHFTVPPSRVRSTLKGINPQFCLKKFYLN